MDKSALDVVVRQNAAARDLLDVGVRHNVAGGARALAGANACPTNLAARKL